jgi:hypothetical protein
MGSLAQRLTGLLKQANTTLHPHIKTATSKLATQYDKVLAENAEYVVKDPEAARKLFKQLVFTNLARCVRAQLRVVRAQPASDRARARHAQPGRLAGRAWVLQPVPTFLC